MKNIPRRTFLEFMGVGAAAALLPDFPSLRKTSAFQLKGIAPSVADKVVLADGFHHEMLIKWNDPISATDRFGFNNDYLAYLPLDPANPNDGMLWVNHEYPDPMFVSGHTGEWEKTIEQVKKEMYSVGGSILRISKEKGKWKVQRKNDFNRRITALTEIPFNWHEPIAGKTTAIGTLANCAGGVTPWGTILTCEENYDLCYGERNWKTGERHTLQGDLEWYRFFDNPPEHYGWVTEVDLKTGQAKKHVALGRCAHECATVKQLPDGRVVVYMGDDSNDQCLYKFISDEPGSLDKGTLYVANTSFGRWISLKYEDQPTLKAKFTSQTEVLIRLREAAKYLGGTPLDRPEDVEINPHDGSILIALTNNTIKKNYTGSILKINEKDGRHDALEFTSETLLTGGAATGFACPDNLAFDLRGNLWFTSDMSGALMHKHPDYLPLKNNGLFVVSNEGAQKGRVVQVGSAPFGAEFTGPFFAPDGQTLFLSVQHPGEYSESLGRLTSHWPQGGNALPHPAVIAISGEGINGF